VVRFQCEGSLRAVLRQFKEQVLNKISESQLDGEVCLSIRPRNESDAPEAQTGDLREQLLELLDEE